MIGHPRLRYREVRTFAGEVKTLAQADRLDSKPMDTIRRRQAQLLRWLVDYAYRHVPFYRDSFEEAGIRPDDVRSLDDSAKIPVLTKEKVLANYPERILAKGFSPRNAYRCTSSGTSGTTGMYLSDWATRNANFALLYRARSAFGYRPKHLEVVFTPASPRPKWWEHMGFHRRVRLSVLQQPQRAIEQLIRLRPDVVYSVPSYLRMICQEDRCKELAEMSTMLVVSSGEILDPRTRQMLETCFQAPVMNLYGAAEQIYISSECPLQRGQHLNMLNTLVEVAKEGESLAPGEIGDILITTLTNKAMPLIRYRIGDAGRMAPQECECGHHGDILENVQGRCDDFLRTRRGREVPAIVAQAAVSSSPHVTDFKIIQKSLNRLVIEITRDVDGATKEGIARNLREALMDPEIDVDFVEVQILRPDRSGKRRSVVREA